MKNSNDKFIIGFIKFLSILIICATIYFSLDVFGVIEVPSKYSIASFFYSKIEVIAAGQNLTENIIPENNVSMPDIDDTNIDDEDIEPSQDNEEENTIVETPGEIQDPLSVLQQFGNENPVEEPEVDDGNIYNESDPKFFYYQQLDEYGKIIYDTLRSDMEELKTGTYTADFDLTFNDLLHQENGTEILNNSFQLAINALTFDNPDMFYIDVTKMYLLTEITTRAFSKTYKVSIGPNGGNYLSSNFSNEDDVNSAIDAIEGIKQEIISNCNDLDTVDKIKVVHDYLVNTVEYDADAGENIYNVYGTLINGRAVCEGYARAGKSILDDLNIPCIIACGTGTNSAGNTESHAWNYIKIDDNWYALDITWDDPIIRGNGTLTEEQKYDYFLNGSEKFFQDHFEDGNIVGESNFKYPTLNMSNWGR